MFQPSGNLSHNYGDSPFLMGKSTISTCQVISSFRAFSCKFKPHSILKNQGDLIHNCLQTQFHRFYHLRFCMFLPCSLNNCGQNQNVLIQHWPAPEKCQVASLVGMSCSSFLEIGSAWHVHFLSWEPRIVSGKPQWGLLFYPNSGCISTLCVTGGWHVAIPYTRVRISQSGILMIIIVE